MQEISTPVTIAAVGPSPAKSLPERGASGAGDASAEVGASTAVASLPETQDTETSSAVPPSFSMILGKKLAATSGHGTSPATPKPPLAALPIEVQLGADPNSRDQLVALSLLGPDAHDQGMMTNGFPPDASEGANGLNAPEQNIVAGILAAQAILGLSAKALPSQHMAGVDVGKTMSTLSRAATAFDGTKFVPAGSALAHGDPAASTWAEGSLAIRGMVSDAESAIDSASTASRNLDRGSTTLASFLPAISAEMAQSEGLPSSEMEPFTEFSDALAHSMSGMVGRDGHTDLGNRTSATLQATATLPVSSTLSAPGWSDEIGGKLTWMVSQNQSSADLVLTPPQLGRIEVSLVVVGDQANAMFASPNAEVRELLENSLPRLREILDSAGINLGEAHVGSEANRQHPRENQADQRLPGDVLIPAGIVSNELTVRNGIEMTRIGNSLVDTFA